MTRRYSALLALLPVLIAGCGGSGGSGHKSTSGEERVGPRVTIAWPAQTRDFAAPTFAAAARIVFPNSGANNFDAVQVVARPAGAAAVNQAVLLDFAVSPGNHLVRVEFLADASGDTPLATASLNLNVGRDGVLRTLDGKPLGTVGYTSKVTGLSVNAGQEIEVGTTSSINVTATTATGVAALPPSAVTLAATSGASLITINPDGTVTGVAPGEVTLTPSIEGLTGSPATLTILPAPIQARVVDLASNTFLFDATHDLVWVATPDGKVQSIDPQSGNFGTSFQVGSNPTVLAISDDGSTLYAGLQSAGAVRRIDLASNTLGLQFNIPNTGFGGACYARDIAVQPGHPSTIGLTTQEFNSSGNNGVEIFDDGVKRPNGLGIYQGTRLVWTSPNRIVTWDTSSTDDRLRGVTVDAQGATTTQSVQSGLNSFSTDFTLAGGRLYDRSGVVFDATALQRVGSFDLNLEAWYAPGILGPAVDLTAKRAYFAKVSNGGLRLYSYNTDTFALVGSRRVAGVALPNGSTPYVINMLKTSDGIALRVEGKIVLIDDLAGL